MVRHFIFVLTFIFTTYAYSQDISFYTSFLGKYDFTMIGNTLNTVPNGTTGPCIINTESSATLNLNATQTIHAAYLYWAGSGSLTNGDLNIKLNGIDITPDRTFLSAMGTNSLPVYGAFKDVTPIVTAQGNGVYTVSDFDLSGVIGPYCNTGGNFGGWSIVVVYFDPSTTNNVVNIYDGFEKVDGTNQIINITLTNLNVLNLTGNKIGFLSWEGDENIAVSEQLRINNNIVSNPPLNPASNVFNGTNSFTGSNQLYNMDLDWFDINDYTNILDNTLEISLQSGQDAVVVNNIVVVLNSEVPDASIQVTAATGPCDIRDISVNYMVHNTIATLPLPAGTPIAFYANDVLIGTSATVNEIPIGGQEPGSINLTVPADIPAIFTFKVVVDDDGTGTGTVIEYNENNNEYETTITLGVTPTVNPFQGLVKCDTNNNGNEAFDLTIVGAQMLGAQTGVLVRYYTNIADANAGNGNNILNPNAYVNTSSPQTIYVRMEDTVGCFIVQDFQISITPPSALAQTLPNLVHCAPSLTSTGVAFDLTQNDAEVLGTNPPLGYTVTYHLSQADAMSGAGAIANPNAYPNISNPQTIWARLVSPEGCAEFGSFTLETTAPEAMDYTVPNLSVCAPSLSPTGVAFDLTQNDTAVLNGNDPATYTVTYHITQNDAQNGVAAIANPTAYLNTSNPQTIWARLIGPEDCVLYGSFLIETTAPEAMDYSLPNLSVCAPTTVLTGIAIDLTQNDTAVLNGNDPANYSITYHINQMDAQNGVSAIANPTSYLNTSNPQTIWVRLIGQDNCVLFGSFQIETTGPTEATYLVPSIEICSPDQVLIGHPTDLTESDEYVLNGNDPNDYVITYHLSQMDAMNAVGAIANPTAYPNLSSPQTIWFRMIDANNCVQYGSFEIIYNPAPLTHNTTPIEECSMGGPATFNLTQINPLIVNSVNNLIFTYHLTAAEAAIGTNPLPNSYTPPTQNATIFVRVEDGFGCFTVVEVELESVVNISNLSDTYFECDSPTEPNDGFTSFNLNTMTNQINISLGLPASIITYHLNAQDAATGANPIANPTNYTNISNPQTLYARALQADGSCGGIAEFKIEVNPVPEFDLPDYVAFCPVDDKMFTFFESYPSYVWYNPDGDVMSNSATVHFNEPGIWTLEVRDAQNGCPARREIEVIYDNPPTITNITVNGNTVTVSANGGTPPYQYSFNNGLTWTNDYIMDNVPGGIYDLIVKSKYGCISTAKTFGVLGIPNFISPNNDGINDYWQIRGLEVYPDAHIQIFDRYGKIFVDRKLNPEFKWDGKYLGNPVPSGDYWYIIQIGDGRSVSGHVSVRNRN